MATSRRDFNEQVYAPFFHGDGSDVTNLTRVNIAAGTPGYVVFNKELAPNAGTLTEEEHLAPSRGGLGGTVSWESQAGGTDGVLVGIFGGETGAFKAFTVSSTASPSTIVVRDGSGNINIGNPTVTNYVTISPTTGVSGVQVVGYCTTINAATETLLSITVTDGGNTNSMILSGDITLLNAAGTSCGTFSIEGRAVYTVGTGVITVVTPLTRNVSSLDAAVNATSVTMDDGGAGALRVRATGQAGQTIKWAGQFHLTQRRI